MAGRPVLVGYDGSADARVATRWALDEAARTDVPVLLVYGFEWLAARGWIGPGIGPGSGPDEQARARIGELLRAAVDEAAVSHPTVRVDARVLDGPPTLRLLEASATASLMVLGSRGHGGFADLLTGSTTLAVSAHARCPVVVVRGDSHPRPGVVLVGVDGSECSLLALDFALDRAASRAVPLRVVRAWTPPDSRAAGVDPDAVSAGERAALEDLLGDRRRRYPEVPVTTEVVAGNPAETLVERSREAQLTVVGSRGHGGFRGLLLGSVSQQLLHHGHSPVAVVRELPADSLTWPTPS